MATAPLCNVLDGGAMPEPLCVAIGQYSDKGRKPRNQDFHGAYIPPAPLLASKGVAIALADGISSSEVSHIASEAAVRGFLEDYFCTSEAWSVKKSAQRVLMATNSWLHAQTRQSQYRFDKDKGYVCTLSAMVIKARTAHIFHVGDTRVYRLHGNALEQLTNDHRYWVTQEKSYLARALGINPQLDIDYHAQALETGDTFLLATDGVYEFVETAFIIATLNAHCDDLDKAAQLLVEQAYLRGSDDNLSAQVVRIERLPEPETTEFCQQLNRLPVPPLLAARMDFDGYRVVRELHASSRSHVYLAVDGDSGAQFALKIPSIDLRVDNAYLERLLTEDWIARRINSAHVLKSGAVTRKQNYLYTVTEYIEGQTLAQWMIDNPKPDLQTVRGIVGQIAKGLQAFHRMEMLHQDLRPANIMIDATGTVKIIDFGSTRVAGLLEMGDIAGQQALLGTAPYTAPEYFLGESGSPRSDQFSLAVICYQMLSGKLPYGTEVAKARSRAAQRRLCYRSVLNDEREVPAWIDGVLYKALHPDPYKRYAELSEFVYDLHHPNQDFLNMHRPSLLENNPVTFWKGVSLLLLLVVIGLSLKLAH